MASVLGRVTLQLGRLSAAVLARRRRALLEPFIGPVEIGLITGESLAGAAISPHVVSPH
ncbi:MAG: hypothetical protein JXB05_06570 [Myxococcaceae bacterium]|nr:hypothetical protein [Myxococcaceae bacterium]